MEMFSDHKGGRTARDVTVSSLSQRLAAEFDPRLADVWLEWFTTRPAEAIDPEVAWLLRMAYLRGYEDALTEPEHGSLHARLGAPIPGRGDRRDKQPRRRTPPAKTTLKSSGSSR